MCIYYKRRIKPFNFQKVICNPQSLKIAIPKCYAPYDVPIFTHAHFSKLIYLFKIPVILLLLHNE